LGQGWYSQWSVTHFNEQKEANDRFRKTDHYRGICGQRVSMSISKTANAPGHVHKEQELLAQKGREGKCVRKTDAGGYRGWSIQGKREKWFNIQTFGE